MVWMRSISQAHLVRTGSAATLFAAAMLAIIALASPRGALAQASVQEVLAVPGPTLTADAHADGVLLSWQFDVSSSPAGWRLGGFRAFGEIFTPGGALWFSPRLPATARSYKDPLTQTTMAERLPGAAITFKVYAFFHRLSDGAEQVGKESAPLVFRAPKLPGPSSFGYSIRTGGVNNPHVHPLQLTWSHPHLAWDSSTGFDRVSGYILYRHGEQIVRYNRPATSYSWNTIHRCEGGYKIRVIYGLFYSGLHQPAEWRHNC